MLRLMRSPPCGLCKTSSGHRLCSSLRPPPQPTIFFSDRVRIRRVARGVYGRTLLSEFGPTRYTQLLHRSLSTVAEPLENENENEDDLLGKEPPAASSPSNMYARVTPIEHVLLRPGMYVGSTSPQRLLAANNFYYDKDSKKMLNCTPNGGNAVTPALIKVFDEILVNACDNHRRDGSTKRIDVTVDPDTGAVTIYNDGKGIPVMKHDVEGVWIPELLFGYLLTGSNFDDSESNSSSKTQQKYSNTLTGGRHGYGAKLSNIFSSEFTVTTCDTKRKLQYEQTWDDNMSTMRPAVITKVEKNASDFTQISFRPDLIKLTGTPHFSSDDYHQMCKRVVDVKGVNSNLTVTLNGEPIEIDSFKDYCELYRPDVACAKVNNRWEVGVASSDGSDGSCVSFVNSMATTRGGTHVDHITAQIVNKFYDHIKKKHPDLPLAKKLVRARLTIFVNCLIESPSFDSQMKEMLTTSVKDYGSSPVLKPAQLNRLLSENSAVVHRIVKDAKSKQREKIYEVRMSEANTLKKLASKIPSWGVLLSIFPALTYLSLFTS